MSYTILYRTMFVKVDNDQFIPLYECGDNNVWECDLRRRARNWEHHYPCFLRKDLFSLPFFTEKQLIDLTAADVEQQEYCGTHISGKGCASRNDLINYWRRGVKRAKTFDEIHDAGIKLQVTDTNYGDDAPHFSKEVRNVDELIAAWTQCLAECGTAELIPCDDVSEFRYKSLYPAKPKVLRNHENGFVVKFGYRYVSKMTPRSLWHTDWLTSAKKYTTRSAAEKVVQRIKTRYTSITEKVEIQAVRKNSDTDRWELAA